MNTDSRISADTRWSFRASLLVGIGIMAAVDEIVFHQILRWHHFFDLATSTVGIVSDGLLHAVELVFIVLGFFLLLDQRRRQTLDPSWAWAGGIIGMGAFQLFDGIVDHKLLRLHQIRYVDDLIYYDVAWNVAALVLILTGSALALRARARARASGAGY